MLLHIKSLSALIGLTLFCTLFCITTAQAKVFVCTKIDGSVEYSDTPCSEDSYDQWDTIIIKTVQDHDPILKNISASEILKLAKEMSIKNFSSAFNEKALFIKALTINGKLNSSKVLESKRIQEISSPEEAFQSRFYDMLNHPNISEVKQMYVNDLSNRIMEREFYLSCSETSNLERAVTKRVTDEFVNEIDKIERWLIESTPSPLDDPMVILGLYYSIDEDLQHVYDTVKSEHHKSLLSNANIVINNGKPCPQAPPERLNMATSTATVESSCIDDHFDAPYSIRWANENPSGSECYRLVQEVRELGNNKNFNCDDSVRSQWEHAFNQAERRGCKL